MSRFDPYAYVCLCMPDFTLNRQESELLAEAVDSYRQFVATHDGYDALFPRISDLSQSAASGHAIRPGLLPDARDLFGTFLPFDRFVEEPAAQAFLKRLNGSIADVAPYTLAPRELWGVRDLLAQESRVGLNRSSRAEGRLSPAEQLRLQTERVRHQRATENQKPFKVVVLGDVHGRWNKVQRILDHEFPEGNGMALAVGDLANYPSLSNGHRIHFIPGNHENFAQVAQMRWGSSSPFDENYSPIFAGDLLRLGGLTVAGIPAVYSPWFFDHPKYAPMKYFTPHDIEALKALGIPIDILLMHEAPHGIGFEKGGEDLGKPVLTGLVEYLRPRLVFFGHHHVPFNGMLGDTAIVGLEQPKHSYVVLEYDPKKGELVLGETKTDLATRTVLFGSPLPLDRKNRFVSLLKNRHRENVGKALIAAFLEALPAEINDREFKAKVRAFGAINEAIDFVAEYLAALEARPHLSVAGKRDVLTEIFQRMRHQAPSYAMDDVNRAFEAFLREMGMVDVENFFIREVKTAKGSGLDPSTSLPSTSLGAGRAGIGQVASPGPVPALLDSTEQTGDERTDVRERRILPFGGRPKKPSGSNTGGDPLIGALILAGGLSFAGNRAWGAVEDRLETTDYRPETTDQRLETGNRIQETGNSGEDIGTETVDENVETVEVPVDEGAESSLSPTVSGLMPWTTPFVGAGSALLRSPAVVLLRR